jgi:hypothetical protein
LKNTQKGFMYILSIVEPRRAGRGSVAFDTTLERRENRMTKRLLTDAPPELEEASGNELQRSGLALALALIVALGTSVTPDSAHAGSPGDAAVTYCIAGGAVAGLVTVLATFSVTAAAGAATVGCIMAGGQEALAETMK